MRLEPASADPIPDITGALLAGGRAARLGGLHKGLLVRDGETLAAHGLSVLRALFGRVLLVGDALDPYRDLGAECVPDRVPGRGAPGGLHAALSAAGTPWVFVAACDMPFLSAPPIRFLAAARQAGDRAVVVRFGGRLQVLHALWSADALPVLEAQLAAGRPGSRAPSLRALAAALPARIIEEDAWRAVDPGGRSFEDADTPEDLARLGLLQAHQL